MLALAVTAAPLAPVPEHAAPSLLARGTHATMALPPTWAVPSNATAASSALAGSSREHGGRPTAPSVPSTPGFEAQIMGILDKVSRGAIFKQRVDQIQYWAKMTQPLWELGLGKVGEFPDVPNQMAWWMHGNPFDVWHDEANGPLTSESHTCHGLLQSWLVSCGKGPFYSSGQVYDPHGRSGPEADEDDSCNRMMEQYTRLCQKGTDSQHHLSAFQ